ncbi:hypothetical protein DFH06DRAFT_1407082 [Mycena polygramma]|nr:hypothetical protein DFH06DRAFT_1407082 [Mycena polygramma]
MNTNWMVHNRSPRDHAIFWNALMLVYNPANALNAEQTEMGVPYPPAESLRDELSSYDPSVPAEVGPQRRPGSYELSIGREVQHADTLVPPLCHTPPLPVRLTQFLRDPPAVAPSVFNSFAPTATDHFTASTGPESSWKESAALADPRPRRAPAAPDADIPSFACIPIPPIPTDFTPAPVLSAGETDMYRYITFPPDTPPAIDATDKETGHDVLLVDSGADPSIPQNYLVDRSTVDPPRFKTDKVQAAAAAKMVMESPPQTQSKALRDVTAYGHRRAPVVYKHLPPYLFGAVHPTVDNEEPVIGLIADPGRLTVGGDEDAEETNYEVERNPDQLLDAASETQAISRLCSNRSDLAAPVLEDAHVSTSPFHAPPTTTASHLFYPAVAHIHPIEDQPQMDCRSTQASFDAFNIDGLDSDSDFYW